MISKDSREDAAANAVATHLSEVLDITMAARRWDDGSRDGMHDFYVEADGHQIALEVTTIADGQRVGRDVRWEREAPGGWVRVEGLIGCWIVYHEGETEASDVIRAIQGQLPRLEALGLTQIDARSWQRHFFDLDALRPLGYEQLAALNLVGITQASRIAHVSDALQNDHGGEVHVVRGFGVQRPADRNFPVSFIDEQLRDPALHRSDVQKLLSVKDATARHLWMWVELTEGFSMIRSFEAEGLPDADIDAEGIDGVWLGRSPAPAVVAGFSWLRGLGWSEFSDGRDYVVEA